MLMNLLSDFRFNTRNLGDNERFDLFLRNVA